MGYRRAAKSYALAAFSTWALKHSLSPLLIEIYFNVLFTVFQILVALWWGTNWILTLNSYDGIRHYYHFFSRSWESVEAAFFGADHSLVSGASLPRLPYFRRRGRKGNNMAICSNFYYLESMDLFPRNDSNFIQFVLFFLFLPYLWSVFGTYHLLWWVRINSGFHDPRWTDKVRPDFHISPRSRSKYLTDLQYRCKCSHTLRCFVISLSNEPTSFCWGFQMWSLLSISRHSSCFSAIIHRMCVNIFFST